MKVDFSPSLPPPTRYQGSKHKLLDWLWRHLKPLPFQTCLDAFSGSACVSHFLKGRGKSVTCNDFLHSSAITARALVENDAGQLDDSDVDFLIARQANWPYDDLIARTFEDIYFTADENRWLDIAAQNIPLLSGRYRQSIAYHALFQSALAKRPYNLFHRRNLYMRTAEVERSFGNKTTWDTPFEEHFRRYVEEANRAILLGPPCRAIQGNALDVPGEFDLVYIDPPYLNADGVGVDYHGFYHFLEGLADYGNWEPKIDFTSRHRRLQPIRSPWTHRATVGQAFMELFERFRGSILAVSYRTDGIPSLEELTRMLAGVKRHVSVHTFHRRYKYALSTNSRSSEALLIARD